MVTQKSSFIKGSERYSFLKFEFSILVMLFALSFSMLSEAASTGNSGAGATKFVSNGCTGCHTVGGLAGSPRMNAANASNVITYAVTNDFGGQMAGTITNATDKDDIAAYLATFLATPSATVGFRVSSNILIPDLDFNAPSTNGAAQPFNTIATVPSGGNTSQGGTVTFSISGSDATAHYTPPTNFTGTDTFSYQANGPAGTSSVRTMTITVNPPATPTVSATALRSVAFNSGSNSLNLSALITNAGSSFATTLNVTQTGTAHGTFSVSGTTMTFTPATNYTGPVTFNYQAVGPTGLTSSTGALTINVDPPGVPTANSFSSSVAFNSSNNSISLSGNISGSAPLTIEIITPPTHGSASISGSNIVYTPTTNYEGADSIVYRVKDVVNQPSSNATLSITVNAAGAPSASNKSASVMAGSTANQIDLTSVISSVAPTVALIVASPSHGSATVSGNIISYTPNADFSGTDTLTFKSKNTTVSMLESGVATLTITVNAVGIVASNANYKAKLNTVLSANLKTDGFVTGTAATGIKIVSQPAHGTVNVSGTSFTYTPVTDFFGTDTFQYSAFGATGESSPATVTITIDERPDPRNNQKVMGMVNSQTDTTKRMARTQTGFLQLRTEGVHSRLRSGGSSSSGALAALNPKVGTQFSQAEKIDQISKQLELQSKAQAPLSSEVALADTPNDTATIQAVSLLGAGGSANKPVTKLTPAEQTLASIGNTLVAALGSKSINLAGLSTQIGGDASGEHDPIEVWMMGNIRFGVRDNNDGDVLSRFHTSGVTIGMDKKFTKNLILGVGLGYAREKTNISDDGSQSVARGVSGSVYASYMPYENWFIDGALGYGVTNFDSERFVDAANDFAKMNRSGKQYFGVLTTSYEFKQAGLLFAPYLRLNVERNRLESGTEKGAGLNALNFSEQSATTGQVALGFRAEATHKIDAGLAIPHARIEFQRSIDKNDSSTIRYADQLNGSGFNMSSTTNNSRGILLGFGNDFMLNNGLKVSFEYQTLRGEGDDNSQSLFFRVAKDLGGPEYQQAAIATTDEALTRLGIRLDAGYTYDDNVSRSELAGDKEKDSIYSIRLNKNVTFGTSEHTRIVLSGFLGGERFDRFRGLENVSAGLQGEFQYRPSGAFSAPTFGVLLKSSIEEYESRMRDSTRYAAGFTFRKPWSEKLNLFSAITYNIRDSNSEVFDTEDTAARINLDYMITKKSSVYVAGEYRFGDTLSAGSPSIKNADMADVLESDDVFTNKQLTQYRFKGKTYMGTLGLNVPLGARDAIDLSWRYIQSSPDDIPSYVDGDVKYRVNQFSLVYLVRF